MVTVEGSRLEGVILRSQLLVLLQRRHFCDQHGRPVGREYSEKQEIELEVGLVDHMLLLSAWHSCPGPALQGAAPAWHAFFLGPVLRHDCSVSWRKHSCPGPALQGAAPSFRDLQGAVAYVLAYGVPLGVEGALGDTLLRAWTKCIVCNSGMRTIAVCYDWVAIETKCVLCEPCAD
jgi:hypothetical protein